MLYRNTQQDSLDIFNILKIVFDKFSNTFSGRMNFVKTKDELHDIFGGSEILCKNDDINILVTNRELSEYEKNLCRSNSYTELEEIKIGYYAFMLVANKEKKDLNGKSKYTYQDLMRDN